MDYSILAKFYDNVQNTSKRLEKTNLISELLKKTSKEDLNFTIPLIRGKIFADWDKQNLGVASSIAKKAIIKSYGLKESDVDKTWRELGDLGLVAEKLGAKKTQSTLFSSTLSVRKVFDNIKKIATTDGKGSIDVKISLISELLSGAKPLEARYIIRTVLEDLRAGIGDGTLRDAIVWAYLFDPKYENGNIDVNREEYQECVDKVQEALDRSNDFSEVANAAANNKLDKVDVEVGKPLKVMLAQKVKTVEEAFKAVGKPAIIEYKYDGFRMQIHKGKEVRMFTRRLEEVTKQFPEVKEYVQKYVKGGNIILDCEAVGYDPKTEKYLPFQNISQRIRRKYDIEEVAKKLPIELNIFDVLHYNNKTLLNTSLRERREILEKIVTEEKHKIRLSRLLESDNEEKAQKFYEESLEKGNEGAMFKNPDSPYKPGSRVGFMIKLKSAMETLDLAVVGAEWGEGKRSGWLTSFTLACVDDGEFLTIGKVGTGVKEKPEEGLSFGELTESLKPHIVKENGREVIIKPKIVLEIQFEEIQKSPSYASGYALRFPRVKVLREDRDPDTCSSLDSVEYLFRSQ